MKCGHEVPDRVGDDGLLEPVESPRWLVSLDDWVVRELAKPLPRPLRWLDHADRLPSWSVPLIVAGVFGGLAALARWLLR